MKSKKGQMGNVWTLVSVVLAFVVIGIIAAIGLGITNDVKVDQTVDSAAYNASVDSEKAVLNITKKTPTVATAVIFGVIIAILLGIVAYFGVMR